jgi:hypothetical protein
VYPRTGEASLFSVGSAAHKQRRTPVLFTLAYYGFHDPESESIRLMAIGGSWPQTGQHTVRLNGRTVTMASSTEGALHNVVTTASWDEHGDVVTLATEGLTPAETARFIEGLVEHEPPDR